jgi:hypothetical protein
MEVIVFASRRVLCGRAGKKKRNREISSLRCGRIFGRKARRGSRQVSVREDK